MTNEDAGLAWEVMARYDEPASAAFDAILAAAGLDEMTARALRFWQREAVHNTKQYAAQAIPAVFAAIEAAQADVQAATRRSEQAWHSARRTPPSSPDVSQLPEPTPAGEAAVERDDLLEQRRRTVAARLAQSG